MNSRKKRLLYIFAFLTVVCMSIMTIMYTSSIIFGNTKPTIMTWVFFAIAVSMSFATYWNTENHSILGNIANFVDIFFVGIILSTTVIISVVRHIAFELNIFTMFCIVLVLFILMFWKITKSHRNSFIALQVMMIVAYFPMLYSLWTATECNEPLVPWFINLLAGVSNISSAVVANDKLSKIYSSRMFIMLSIVILLILRGKYL